MTSTAVVNCPERDRGRGRGIQNTFKLQSGAAGCVKGFLTCFLEVPLPCLGSNETVAFLAFANFGVVYYDFAGQART